MNNKTVSIEDYNEVFGHVEYFSSKCNRLEEEMQYMHDFINWMHLGDMYRKFREKAYVFQPEDESFPYYTMDDEKNVDWVVCS